MSTQTKVSKLAITASAIIQKIINNVPPAWNRRLRTNAYHFVFNNAILINDQSTTIKISRCITYDAKHIYFDPDAPDNSGHELVALFRNIFADLMHDPNNNGGLYVLVLGNATVYLPLKKDMEISEVSETDIHILRTIRLRMGMDILSSIDTATQAQNACILLKMQGIENIMETLELK